MCLFFTLTSIHYEGEIEVRESNSERRSASDRRQYNTSMIGQYAEYSGIERRSGLNRRVLADRRK